MMTAIFTVIVAAASQQPARPIYALMLDANFCKDAVDLSNIGNQMKSRSDIESDGPKAVAAAGRHADLKQAVKEFYAAASAYCENPSRSLGDALSTKEQALKLELKLAGM